MIFTLQLFLALLLDALLGDPVWYPHPVKGIGRLCAVSERISRSRIGNLYLAGTVTVLTVLGGTCGLVYLVLVAAASISLVVEAFVGVVLLYTSVAARDLLAHSRAVYDRLAADQDLAPARAAVAKIVGRDTAALDRRGICRATIETVAENMVDGITAPLFFAVAASCLGSPGELSALSWAVIGAYGYKAINTMDSMIGYKNDHYRQFGLVAARLDDAANFIPARLSGCCLIVAAIFLKLDYRGAARIFFRDRLRHASPNAGHTEAACAGALGVRLGGPSSYFGRIVEKPFIGDPVREAEAEDIHRANRLVVVGTAIFVALLCGLRGALL